MKGDQHKVPRRETSTKSHDGPFAGGPAQSPMKGDQHKVQQTVSEFVWIDFDHSLGASKGVRIRMKGDQHKVPQKASEFVWIDFDYFLGASKGVRIPMKGDQHKVT